MTAWLRSRLPVLRVKLAGVARNLRPGRPPEDQPRLGPAGWLLSLAAGGLAGWLVLLLAFAVLDGGR